MDKVKENSQDNNFLFILCNNYCAEGWNAVAVWSHKPTKEDILKVGLFKEYPDRNIEQVLSKRIAKYGKCRLNFIEYKKYYNHWIEYIVINPDENGDLNLTDLLMTGHCDCIEECNIYEEDFI